MRGVNLGGWLLTEKWTCPSLWDALPDKELLDGARLQLQSTSSGCWLTALGGGGGRIEGSALSNGSDETFVLWRLPGDTFCLRSGDGHFVVVGEEAQLEARSTTADDAFVFQIERNPADSYHLHLRTTDGKYLQVSPSSTSVVIGSSIDPGWSPGPSTFALLVWASLQGDFALMNGLGGKAEEVMHNHWDTFITEDDIRFASDSGFNALRIPIGWWLASEEAPWPYVGGAAYFLDQAFEWAHRCGLFVLVDLHAVPGSCNGWDLGGTRDGEVLWAEPENVQKTLEVVEWVARRYGAHPAFLGMQLLNEPRTVIPMSLLGDYYQRGYALLAHHAPEALVVCSCYIDGNPAWFQDMFKDKNPNKWRQAVVDIGHFYSSYAFQGKAAHWFIRHVFTQHFVDMVAELNAAFPIPTIVGEWSLELANAVPKATDVDIEEYGKVQCQVWGRTGGGWFYYTLKTKTPNDTDWWSAEKSIQHGWLHRDQWEDTENTQSRRIAL